MTILPLTNSDFPTDQTSHQFHDLDTELVRGFQGAFKTITGVACQQGTLTLLDTWFRPPFVTCLCSNCWDQISRTCRVFTSLLTLNTPRYFLDFALLFTKSLVLEYNVFAILLWLRITEGGSMQEFRKWSILFILCSNTLQWSDITLTIDLAAELDLIAAFHFLFNQIPIGFQGQFATCVYHQRTLNSPDTQSCPILDLLTC